jgi:outer membrane protein OmpA-like peptidoglycan-associated protein
MRIERSVNPGRGRNLGLTVVMLAACTIGVVGCAPRQNRSLEEARRAYLAASSDPKVVQYAAAPLQEAGMTLDRAEVEHRRGNQSEVRHLSYVAQQEVAKARQVASERQARVESEALSAARDGVVIAAREQQLDTVLAELAALDARETAQGLALTMSDVFFEFDSAQRRPAARQDLARLAAFVREHPDRNVVIEGYTDSLGSDAYNAELSARRADSVKAFLVQQGVEPTRLIAQGFGENHPIASNDDEAGRQRNRRVEMLVMNPGRVVTISTTPIIVR